MNSKHCYLASSILDQYNVYARIFTFTTKSACPNNHQQQKKATIKLKKKTARYAHFPPNNYVTYSQNARHTLVADFNEDRASYSPIPIPILRAVPCCCYAQC